MIDVYKYGVMERITVCSWDVVTAMSVHVNDESVYYLDLNIIYCLHG